MINIFTNHEEFNTPAIEEFYRNVDGDAYIDKRLKYGKNGNPSYLCNSCGKEIPMILKSIKASVLKIKRGKKEYTSIDKKKGITWLNITKKWDRSNRVDCDEGATVTYHLECWNKEVFGKN